MLALFFLRSCSCSCSCSALSHPFWAFSSKFFFHYGFLSLAGVLGLVSGWVGFGGLVWWVGLGWFGWGEVDGGLEGWRGGGMEGWRDGGMDGCRDGGMEGWRDGGMEG